MSEELIIDVRTREEFVLDHIKGAINIPHYDLEFYEQFLKDKNVILYCNTERRSAIAKKKLEAMGIEAKVLSLEEQESYEVEENAIVCAANFISLKPGREETFREKAMGLCRATESMDGFLGSKVLKLSGISSIGSCIPGDDRDLEMKPIRYVLLTYWESKEAHEISHKLPEFADIFGTLLEDLVMNPYEEFYEVLK